MPGWWLYLLCCAQYFEPSTGLREQRVPFWVTPLHVSTVFLLENLLGDLRAAKAVGLLALATDLLT